MFRKLAFVSPLALALVAGCSGDGNGPKPIQSRVALTAFNSCSALETYVEDTAVDQMNAQLDSILSGDGWGWGWLAFGGAEDAARSAGGAPPASPSAPTAYTKTNTQVEGVDEADFVKTDGTRIFVLSGTKLYITRSWPAADLSLASSIELDGYPADMFLDENNRVVVFSHWAPDRAADQLYWCAWGCGYSGMTKVTVIDVADSAAPRVTDEIYLPGSYANARRIGSSIRLVQRDYMSMPDDVIWWPDFRGDWEKDRDQLEAMIEQTKIDNERKIRARSLREWLPDGWRVANGNQQPLERQCNDFYQSNAEVRLGLASVSTIRLGASVTVDSAHVLGEVGEIYASHSSLYIATPHWWWWPAAGQTDYTYIHKFDITDPNRAIYVASGGVEGYPLNQFSLDEHQGFLRVATTISRRVEDVQNPWGRVETTNRVSVMNERSGNLSVVGATPDIATGERIQSARFIGEKGFVVTFEQIDPLFTLNLSDPTHPRVIGELKVPGFSSYLHPLDENHLLAIGVHLPDPTQGQVDWSERSMKLTIFDVSDFENPREKFTQHVGTAYGWSEAAWEHKAFNYFPERKMLAIPFSDFRPSANDYWDAFVSDLRLFRIDADEGIAPRGSLSMRDLYVRYSYDQWSWDWSPWIRRSVMADDFVYAVSDAGIRVSNMSAASTPVATVLFDRVIRN